LPKSMPPRIEEIVQNSMADKAGIRTGDRLVEINGHTIRDVIDFQYYAADDILDCTVLRDGEIKQIQIYRHEGDSLGIGLEAIQFKSCGNLCIFCFIDQNPPGMRQSIYFKDEDYRLSFLHGNYVTLTRVKQEDLDRIVEQRLSPLYISIHATDSDVRCRMLGLSHDDNLLKKIAFLINHGIEIHGQIVLCPGYNDEDLLVKSITRLSKFYPSLRTLAIVPVGLTNQRHKLEYIDRIDAQYARQVLNLVKPLQDHFIETSEGGFIFLADEFYILAGQELPNFDHYGDFCQIENGIGLMRFFLNDFSEAFQSHPKAIEKTRRFVLATGVLAGPIIEKMIAEPLSIIENLHCDVRIIKNQFYGESVTVTGLLTGFDIIKAFQDDREEFTLLLPPNCVNEASIMLDDLTVNDLEKRLKRPVCILESFEHIWNEEKDI